MYACVRCVRCVCAQAHLDLNGPGEVADIDKEGYVGAVAEVKVLVGETVLKLFDVTAGHNRDLFARLGSCWRGPRSQRRRRRRKEKGWSTFMAGFTSVQ